MSLKKQKNNVVSPVRIGTARYQTFRGEWERRTDTPGRGCHQGYLRRVTGQRLLHLLNQAVRDYREKQGGEHHDA
ncbi:hypothetical protein AU892_24140 [Salmonella enterica subsp. diarizonae]|nr:hypothetical protein [Salmonella enterica subsp. diarizonae]